MMDWTTAIGIPGTKGNLIMCFIKENKEGAIGIDILKESSR
jgi:hypothetical protein